jgi:SET domain-containing protein
MAFETKQLKVKRSTLPSSGKGLFAKKDIRKGERIVEYRGRITTWRDIGNQKSFNGYVYYINRSHVIDARRTVKALARYANDARGMSHIKGISNNSRYVIDNTRVFIEATRNIAAGAEILVGYGKEYWDVVRENKKTGN